MDEERDGSNRPLTRAKLRESLSKKSQAELAKRNKRQSSSSIEKQETKQRGTDTKASTRGNKSTRSRGKKRQTMTERPITRSFALQVLQRRSDEQRRRIESESAADEIDLDFIAEILPEDKPVEKPKAESNDCTCTKLQESLLKKSQAELVDRNKRQTSSSIEKQETKQRGTDTKASTRGNKSPRFRTFRGTKRQTMTERSLTRSFALQVLQRRLDEQRRRFKSGSAADEIDLDLVTELMQEDMPMEKPHAKSSDGTQAWTSEVLQRRSDEQGPKFKSESATNELDLDSIAEILPEDKPVEKPQAESNDGTQAGTSKVLQRRSDEQGPRFKTESAADKVDLDLITELLPQDKPVEKPQTESNDGTQAGTSKVLQRRSDEQGPRFKAESAADKVDLDLIIELLPQDKPAEQPQAESNDGTQAGTNEGPVSIAGSKSQARSEPDAQAKSTEDRSSGPKKNLQTATMYDAQALSKEYPASTSKDDQSARSKSEPQAESETSLNKSELFQAGSDENDLATFELVPNIEEVIKSGLDQVIIISNEDRKKSEILKSANSDCIAVDKSQVGSEKDSQVESKEDLQTASNYDTQALSVETSASMSKDGQQTEQQSGSEAPQAVLKLDYANDTFELPWPSTMKLADSPPKCRSEPISQASSKIITLAGSGEPQTGVDSPVMPSSPHDNMVINLTTSQKGPEGPEYTEQEALKLADSPPESTIKHQPQASSMTDTQAGSNEDRASKSTENPASTSKHDQQVGSKTEGHSLLWHAMASQVMSGGTQTGFDDVVVPSSPHDDLVINLTTSEEDSECTEPETLDLVDSPPECLAMHQLQASSKKDTQPGSNEDRGKPETRSKENPASTTKDDQQVRSKTKWYLYSDEESSESTGQETSKLADSPPKCRSEPISQASSKIITLAGSGEPQTGFDSAVMPSSPHDNMVINLTTSQKGPEGPEYTEQEALKLADSPPESTIKHQPQASSMTDTQAGSNEERASKSTENPASTSKHDQQVGSKIEGHSLLWHAMASQVMSGGTQTGFDDVVVPSSPHDDLVINLSEPNSEEDSECTEPETLNLVDSPPECLAMHQLQASSKKDTQPGSNEDRGKPETRSKEDPASTTKDDQQVRSKTKWYLYSDEESSESTGQETSKLADSPPKCIAEPQPQVTSKKDIQAESNEEDWASGSKENPASTSKDDQQVKSKAKWHLFSDEKSSESAGQETPKLAETPLICTAEPEPQSTSNKGRASGSNENPASTSIDDQPAGSKAEHQAGSDALQAMSEDSQTGSDEERLLQDPKLKPRSEVSSESEPKRGSTSQTEPDSYSPPDPLTPKRQRKIRRRKKKRDLGNVSIEGVNR